MKERQINFSRNEDPTLVVDKDGKIAERLTKIYSNITMNLGFCHEQLKKGLLTEGMKVTHLSLTESYVTDFLKEMRYDGVLEKEQKERYQEIRSLNEENRKLREQLGDKVSNEDIREKIKSLDRGIDKWWNINGFGHTSNIEFTGYQIRIEFSGMISHAYYSDEDTGKVATDEEKEDYLKEKGFEIFSNYIVSNDKSTELLTKLIKAKYPNAVIREVKTYFKEGVSVFRKIHVVIKDFNDLK